MRRTGATLTVVGTGSYVAIGGATAESDGSQGILADGISGDAEPDYQSFARGYASRFASVTGAPEDVDALATDARNEFNANSDRWVSYGNWLLEEMDVVGSGDVEVGVDFHISRGRWPTRNERTETTIDVSYDDSEEEFTDLEWLDEAPDDPDFQLTLKNRAAENAADELSEFRAEWIGDDEDDHELPDDAYLSELTGKYAGSIGLGEDERNVLELLLGEVNI
ncbi:hypothetical protein ACFQGT_00440 [Natrialbaceae archaeon GCM10025810]